jgi:hypothetical protein
MRGHCAGSVSRRRPARHHEAKPVCKSPFEKAAVTTRLVCSIDSATKNSCSRQEFNAPIRFPLVDYCGGNGENERSWALPMKGRFAVAVAAGAGLYGAALLFSPGAGANPLHPLPTGGPGCFEQQAAFGAAAAPVVLPGPVAGAVPLAPIVPPVPVVPPVPFAPPLPPVVPPVPFAPVVPVAGAGAAPIADGLAGAPITMAAGTGKGAPTGAASKAAEPVVVPGPPPAPVAAEPPQAPIPAVLAGVATAVPACGAVLAPTR